MYALEKVRTSVKVIFHLLQITVILSGVLTLLTVYLLFVRPDSLIPIPPKYLFPITSIGILSIINGFIGFNCLNSERKTKVFLFVLTLSALMNIQIILAISSNRILDKRVLWMNERWNALSAVQKEYVQRKFQCCGLETTSDRSTPRCKFNVPCSSVLESVLRTLRNTSQLVLVYMFFIETLSLCTLSFLKFIK
ncbi:uncharacterized protein VICG_01887 [Vittaforma corneae ATCC 50505]|uniref:Tetraspanin n=1 Tax=Vittaforma corneae (strain ATCC 50505) TaxID=993615 RepID=L2GKF9_VITCO|nr:uncharacterized protein VICG_01887 [Vittaforma corneae ATCC 50505]ELA41094.1 hypothetical protein VICG_01887 [Vittaforma corneae ATCC 50505]